MIHNKLVTMNVNLKMWLLALLITDLCNAVAISNWHECYVIKDQLTVNGVTVYAESKVYNYVNSDCNYLKSLVATALTESVENMIRYDGFKSGEFCAQFEPDEGLISYTAFSISQPLTAEEYDMCSPKYYKRRDRAGVERRSSDSVLRHTRYVDSVIDRHSDKTLLFRQEFAGADIKRLIDASGDLSVVVGGVNMVPVKMTRLYLQKNCTGGELQPRQAGEVVAASFVAALSYIATWVIEFAAVDASADIVDVGAVEVEDQIECYVGSEVARGTLGSNWENVDGELYSDAIQEIGPEATTTSVGVNSSGGEVALTPTEETQVQTAAQKLLSNCKFPSCTAAQQATFGASVAGVLTGTVSAKIYSNGDNIVLCNTEEGVLSVGGYNYQMLIRFYTDRVGTACNLNNVSYKQYKNRAITQFSSTAYNTGACYRYAVAKTAYVYISIKRELDPTPLTAIPCAPKSTT